MEDINDQIEEKKEKDFRIRELFIRCKIFSSSYEFKFGPAFDQIDEEIK